MTLVESRIVAIADVFDALTSDRPYKKAWSADEAARHMQAQAGKAFAPDLLEKFLTLIPEVEALRSQYGDTPEPELIERR